jgi:hypothetical protein
MNEEKEIVKLYNCTHRCWCSTCGEEISKNQMFFCIYKSARRGQARINLCRKCITFMSFQTKIENTEVNKLKKEFVIRGIIE